MHGGEAPGQETGIKICPGLLGHQDPEEESPTEEI